MAQTGFRPSGWRIGVVAWMGIGLIAGFLASFAVNRSGEGIVRDMVLGIAGAWIGGAIFHALGRPGVTGFDVWSIFVAFVGAVILLVLYHAMTGTGRGRFLRVWVLIRSPLSLEETAHFLILSALSLRLSIFSF